METCVLQNWLGEFRQKEKTGTVTLTQNSCAHNELYQSHLVAVYLHKEMLFVLSYHIHISFVRFPLFCKYVSNFVLLVYIYEIIIPFVCQGNV